MLSFEKEHCSWYHRTEEISIAISSFRSKLEFLHLVWFPAPNFFTPYAKLYIRKFLQCLFHKCSGLGWISFHRQISNRASPKNSMDPANFTNRQKNGYSDDFLDLWVCDSISVGAALEFPTGLQTHGEENGNTDWAWSPWNLFLPTDFQGTSKAHRTRQRCWALPTVKPLLSKTDSRVIACAENMRTLPGAPAVVSALSDVAVESPEPGTKTLSKKNSVAS